MERRVNRKQILYGIALLFLLIIICVLVYKVQIREKLYLPIEYTMMTEHKETFQITLSEETSELTEVFLCTVPELRSLSVECTGKNLSAGAVLVMILSDEATGEVYYQEEKKVKKLLTSGAKKTVEMKLAEPITDSAEKRLHFTWRLKDAGNTELCLTANQKQFIVCSFNDQEGNGTNVIYTLKYSENRCLRILYLFLCIALLIFAVICFWMVIICRMKIEHFFLPIALLLGMIFQSLITVGGVPDEPGHLDTAYKYSNKILFVEDTGNPGTIYKRRCDVKMSDMLANGLESNSYYQLLMNTFAKTDDTELMEVSYFDSTNLVPGIVYFPAALGISFGRIMGLSAMLTLQLARIFNLIAFVFLVWFAICLIPYGKNLLGAISLLPIALQQGASASYDAVVNGSLLLFVALCFRIGEKKYKEKWELVLTVLLALFTAVVKGGVYLPLLLLLLIFPMQRKLKEKNRKKVLLQIFVGIAAMAVLFVIFCIKFMPVIQNFFQEGAGQGDSDALYTIPYLLQKPLGIIYIYWNTLVVKGDFLLRGFLGGTLSWLDFKMNWIFEIVFLIVLLLTANVEGDRYAGGRKNKILIAVSCSISVVLIMMSMLVGYTKMRLSYIEGLQGRYFLPLGPALFFLTENRMVHVHRKQCSEIWMTMMLTEILLVLQVAAMI